MTVGDRVNVEPYIICGQCEYCLTGYYQFCLNSKVYGVNLSCERPPHLWGAYGEYLYGAPGSKVHKIAPSVPDEAAALASVLGNGVRWIRTKARVAFGESVVILGAGAQGLATVIAAHEAGANPIIVIGREANPAKWALAAEFGAHHLVDLDREPDPLGRVRELTGGRLADVVVECTGAEPMMQLGLEVARPDGPLCHDRHLRLWPPGARHRHDRLQRAASARRAWPELGYGSGRQYHQRPPLPASKR